MILLEMETTTKTKEKQKVVDDEQSSFSEGKDLSLNTFPKASLSIVLNRMLLT